MGYIVCSNIYRDNICSTLLRNMASSNRMTKADEQMNTTKSGDLCPGTLVNGSAKGKTTDSNDADGLKELASFLRAALKIKETPKVGIICGTGLAHLADHIVSPASIEYEDIPGFPVSTVTGHHGKLFYGKLQGTTVLCMQGRLHPYEGYDMGTCALPLRVMKLLGVETVLMTSAVGGINNGFEVGDLMMVKDHISLPCFAGKGPLIGPNTDEFGPRFFSMVNAYDKELRVRVLALAKSRNFTLREGVYLQIGGPQFETPAEIRALRLLGADCVGMSVCHETIIARHCGLKVLAFGLVTNIAIDDSHADCVHSVHEEVLDMGDRHSVPVSDFINALMTEIF